MTDKEMVSDNTFAVLRENYAAMSACYDEVMELYSSNAIAADSDMEEVMFEAAEVMGEVTQNSITEEDAEFFIEAMIELLNGLSDLIDDMEFAEDKPGEMVPEEDFAILQENYRALIKVYNAVVKAYGSEEIEANADVENVLNEAVAILEEMGAIEREALTEDDMQELNDAMMVILEALTEISGVIG